MSQMVQGMKPAGSSGSRAVAPWLSSLHRTCLATCEGPAVLLFHASESQCWELNHQGSWWLPCTVGLLGWEAKHLLGKLACVWFTPDCSCSAISGCWLKSPCSNPQDGVVGIVKTLNCCIHFSTEVSHSSTSGTSFGSFVTNGTIFY